ncbi:MAG: hypothetical protein ABI273_16825 [Lacunisphaera sp.]
MLSPIDDTRKTKPTGWTVENPRLGRSGVGQRDPHGHDGKTWAGNLGHFAQRIFR